MKVKSLLSLGKQMNGTTFSLGGGMAYTVGLEPTGEILESSNLSPSTNLPLSSNGKKGGLYPSNGGSIPLSGLPK